MTQTISRIFGSAEKASAAVADLKAYGFGDASIHVAAPSAGASQDAVAASIMKFHILKAHAVEYAKRVVAGGTLVTVHAPFGAARPAIDAMEAHSPMDSGVGEPEFPKRTWDSAAPVSSSFNIPALMNGAAPFSAFWGLPVLASRQSALVELSRDAAPLSKALGMKALSPGGAPTSAGWGLPMLSNSAAPLSAMLGMKVLAGDKK